mmetsp:Transcript_5485/g.6381  ORF Transcript_5485/g.6381 Transcript_5485/m.6381 type:complete len:83 (-) Transcript_5485:133-381(-)
MLSLAVHSSLLPIPTDSNFDSVQYSSLEHEFRFARFTFYIQVETKHPHPLTFPSSHISDLQQGDVVVVFDRYDVSCQHYQFR